MNKTLSIALAGFSFTIDEHAYIKLSDYLGALRSSLDAGEADEVMHDIEIRMVEIFRETLGKREVINDSDVEKVIAQIGTPEQIDEQEEAYYSEGKQNSSKTSSSYSFGGNSQKQLFRDPERAKLGGVCAGLAHYTGMDIGLMRAIWVGIAILGIFSAHISTMLLIFVYIILWVVLPKAQSTSDFLKMKGKPVNFDTIKEESNKIVQFANESTQKVGEMYNESKPLINSAGNGAWNVIRYILGAFFAFIAFCFLMGAFFGFGFFTHLDFPPINEMNFYFDDDNLISLLSTIIVIGSLIPAILFGLLATKLISPKTKLRNIGWVLGGLFVILIGISVYFGMSMAKREMFLKGSKDDSQDISISAKSDTLFVDVKQITIPQNFTAYDNDIYSDKKTVFEEDYPDLNIIRKADVKMPYLTVKREAKGYNIPLQMEVPVEISGNKILLPNYIKYPYKDRFRNYNVNYELVVPQNAVVIPLKKDRMNIDDDFDNGNDDDNNSGITVEKNKININGTTIEYNSDDSDSVRINGKKYSKDSAEEILDKMNLDHEVEKSLKNLNINIRSGKKEISIKTR